MRRTIGITTLAVVGVLGTFANARAHAAVTDPGPGLLCGFTSFTDPTVGNGTQTGTVDAGPLAIADEIDPTVVHTGYFVCTIQVNAATHAGADAARVVGPTTPAVIALPDTQVSYTADVDDTVYLCTEVVVDGQHFYWDDDDTYIGGTSAWSSSPTTARCGRSIGGPPPPPLIDIDMLVCPVLAVVFPPEGDIAGVWDCRRY